MVRRIAYLENYGLTLPELFAPPAYHRWHWWSVFWQTHYSAQSFLAGERDSPYLGFAGTAGLLWLAVPSLFHLLKGQLRCIPTQALQVLWILLYSLVGGINLLIGVFGFILFRATNRYSIVILTIALLFLVRQLSRCCPRQFVRPVALGLLVLGLWDQLPPSTDRAFVQQNARVARSDLHFVSDLEKALPSGSKVFQLPVVDFPESPPIHQMTAYEHFRPYLFSRSLHFSYGSDKGRYREAWQKEIEKMPAAQMAAKLEEFGFDAVLVNRRGYEDRGDGLIAELAATGRPIDDRRYWTSSILSRPFLCRVLGM
jgi:phosphoglycerol transferase